MEYMKMVRYTHCLSLTSENFSYSLPGPLDLIEYPRTAFRDLSNRLRYSQCIAILSTRRGTYCGRELVRAEDPLKVTHLVCTNVIL